MNVQTGRLPYECRGRAWDDVTIAKDHQRLPESHQNLEERPGSDTSVASLGRRLSDTFNSDPSQYDSTSLCSSCLWFSVLSVIVVRERRGGRGE